MIRTATRDADCALIRVLNHTVISAMSTSTEVTSNLVSAVLRFYIIILLTLKASQYMTFLRVNINVVILIIQKNIILYIKIDLS